MLKLEMIIAFAIYLVPISLITFHSILRAKKIERHMQKRKEYALTYKEAVELNNKFIELLIQGELEKYQEITKFILRLSCMLKFAGIDLVGSDCKLDSIKLDINNRDDKGIKALRKEVKKAPKDVRNLLYAYISLAEKILKIRFPILKVISVLFDLCNVYIIRIVSQMMIKFLLFLTQKNDEIKTAIQVRSINKTLLHV